MQLLFGFFIVLPIILIIILGNLLRRYNFLKENDAKILSRILYWVILPALLFRRTFNAGQETFHHSDLLRCFLISYILTVAIVMLLSHFYNKGDIKKIGVSIIQSIRTNNTYIGFPIISLALGDRGLEQAAISFSISIFLYNIISVGAAEFALNGKLSLDSVKDVFKSLLKNPLVLACAAGIACSVAGVPKIEFIDRTLKTLADAATTVALLSLGATLDISSIKSIIGIFRRTWCDVLVRYTISPIIIYCMLKYFNAEPLISAVSVLIAAMPAAVNCFVIAREMGMDVDYAADVVAATTLFSIIAIPLWMVFLGISH